MANIYDDVPGGYNQFESVAGFTPSASVIQAASATPPSFGGLGAGLFGGVTAAREGTKMLSRSMYDRGRANGMADGDRSWRAWLNQRNAYPMGGPSAGPGSQPATTAQMHAVGRIANIEAALVRHLVGQGMDEQAAEVVARKSVPRVMRDITDGKKPQYIHDNVPIGVKQKGVTPWFRKGAVVVPPTNGTTTPPVVGTVDAIDQLLDSARRTSNKAHVDYRDVFANNPAAKARLGEIQQGVYDKLVAQGMDPATAAGASKQSVQSILDGRFSGKPAKIIPDGTSDYDLRSILNRNRRGYGVAVPSNPGMTTPGTRGTYGEIRDLVDDVSKMNGAPRVAYNDIALKKPFSKKVAEFGSFSLNPLNPGFGTPEARPVVNLPDNKGTRPGSSWRRLLNRTALSSLIGYGVGKGLSLAQPTTTQLNAEQY